MCFKVCYLFSGWINNESDDSFIKFGLDDGINQPIKANQEFFAVMI